MSVRKAWAIGENDYAVAVITNATEAEAHAAFNKYIDDYAIKHVHDVDDGVERRSANALFWASGRVTYFHIREVEDLTERRDG